MNSKYQGNAADVLRSKRFITMLVALLVLVVVGVVPDLADQADLIGQGALALGLVLIAGYSVQDAISEAQKTKLPTIEASAPPVENPPEKEPDKVTTAGKPII